MKIAKIPKGLKVAGRKFWKKVLNEYELADSHDLERLSMACKCLDTLADAEKRVDTDGLFSVNRYGATVEHPGVKMIRDNRMLFVKIIRELNLDIPAPVARPPRNY
jgi:phage terminase small subunit